MRDLPALNVKIIEALTSDSWLVIPDLHGSKFSFAAFCLAHVMARNIIQLGDIIDVRREGCSGIEALDAMISLKEERPETVFVRGNHEQKFLDQIALGLKGETLDLSPNDTLSELLQLYKNIEGIPEKYIKFIKETVIYHETQSLLFMHGGVTRGKAATLVSELTEDEMLGSYDVSSYWKGKKIVRGHKPVQLPEEWSNHINTEACGWMPDRPLRLSIVRDQIGQGNLVGWIEISNHGTKMVTI